MAEYVQTNMHHLGMPCQSGALHSNFKDSKIFFFFSLKCVQCLLFLSTFCPLLFFFFYFCDWTITFLFLVLKERKGKKLVHVLWNIHVCDSVKSCILEIGFPWQKKVSLSSSVNLKLHQKPKTNSWSQLTPAEAHRDFCSPLKADPILRTYSNPRHFCSGMTPTAPKSLQAPNLIATS